MCLGCQSCESGPVVTLITGKTVCTACPDWKDECAARKTKADELMAMPLDQRREAFKGYREEMGPVAAARLWKVMQELEKGK